MPDESCKNSIDSANQDRLAQKLVEADLLLAAEAFGVDLDDSKRVAVDSATCPEKDFLQRVMKIAEITGDKLLAEKVEQKQKYPELKYPLSLITVTVSEVYAERFYSYWEDGDQVFIRTEISDFPQWYNTARRIADQNFTSNDLESILVISCAKDQTQKSPLLWKLLDNAFSTETIRLGHLYPDRDMAGRVFSELIQKLSELLTIREQHDSSLQLGEHPEELIPYVWANIIKNLMNRQLCEALDNINALAYLHYAAEKTESITGTAAYAELKNGLVLFSEGKQCSWPNELRKLFTDPTMVEALLRYRFTHGLIAVNTALAFLAAEQEGSLHLNPRDEDAIVLNGLLLTQTGYLRSSGIYDPSVKEQFLRDTCYFKNVRNVIDHQSPDSFFRWREDMETTRVGLENNLSNTLKKIDILMEEKRQAIPYKEEAVSQIESQPEKENKTFLKKFMKDNTIRDSHDKVESLQVAIEDDKKALNDLNEIRRLNKEMARFIKSLAGFFD